VSPAAGQERATARSVTFARQGRIGNDDDMPRGACDELGREVI
jgi:hypothetical protein